MIIIVCRTIVCRSNRIRLMKNQTVINFGNKIRAIRTELGLSQEQLADRAGLHRTYIGMVERGEKNVTLVNINKLADALGVSISELFN